LVHYTKTWTNTTAAPNPATSTSQPTPTSTIYFMISELLLNVLVLAPLTVPSSSPVYHPSFDSAAHASMGAGRVWLAGSKYLEPIFWRIVWPDSIISRLMSSSNPMGDLTINNLEMAALLLHQLMLEQLVDLKHQYTASWIDNKSTVSWIAKLTFKQSKVGQWLVCALALQHCTTQSFPLAPLMIAGLRNLMANLASRSFC
jgi:hypothetical protein